MCCRIFKCRINQAILFNSTTLLSSIQKHYNYFVKAGDFNPKLPLNFIDGKSYEAEDKTGCFSIEEPATGKW